MATKVREQLRNTNLRLRSLGPIDRLILGGLTLGLAGSGLALASEGLDALRSHGWGQDMYACPIGYEGLIVVEVSSDADRTLSQLGQAAINNKIPDPTSQKKATPDYADKPGELACEVPTHREETGRAVPVFDVLTPAGMEALDISVSGALFPGKDSPALPAGLRWLKPEDFNR